MMVITRFVKNVVKIPLRLLSGSHVKQQWDPAINDRMSAWQIYDYKGISELCLNSGVRVPPITNPWDILVHVNASSVNPIDVMMSEGYGLTIMSTLRGVEQCGSDVKELPLTLGRDLSGTVVEVGKLVTSLSRGDPVWGVVGVQRPGTHSQYALSSAFGICRKPTNLSNVEAASIPYAGLTAWSAMSLCGHLKGKKVLLLGATGGVGTILLQLMAYYGAQVIVTCSSSGRGLVERLGADMVIDYHDDGCMDSLATFGRYDCVLDCAGVGLGENSHPYVSLMFEHGRYVSLSSPLLQHTDKMGLVGGAVKFAGELMVRGALERRVMLPAYFTPNPQALRTITSLVEQGKIVPIIDSVYTFEETPQAYQRIKDGHLRGKVVIDFENST